MLWQQTTAPAMTFSYDALGRRVSLDNPQTFYFYDGMDVIRSIVNPQAGQTVSDFARLPGGEVVASSVSGGAQAGTRIALHDIAGSTIALVNPSTGAVETQYTYDPAGVVGMAGASSTFPFLFQGMEYDVPTGLYHTGSNYYSPQLTRPVSEVGPTPSRTRGNPSSPGDVPGFGGGGGSFAWTYNNLQPQLSASIAAGAGAAGLTAGAAALVSTLGLEVGLTVSAAGPVGAVVGALTGLGFLFADLFGGGPDIPRELRLPAHSPEGLESAGQVDQVSQAIASPPAQAGVPAAQLNSPWYPDSNSCSSVHLSLPHGKELGEALGEAGGEALARQAGARFPRIGPQGKGAKGMGKLGGAIGKGVGAQLEKGITIGPPASACTPTPGPPLGKPQ